MQLQRGFALFFAAACLQAATSVQQVDRVVSGDPDPQAQVIEYNKLITPTCDAVERYNTVFHVPNGERIVDIGIGDQLIWVTSKSKTGDAAYAKPQMMGLKTNIDISTDHGNHYSCFVVDVSEKKGYHPRLNVYFEPTDQVAKDNLKGPQQLFTREEMEARDREIETYKRLADEAQLKASAQVRQVQATAAENALANAHEDYIIPEKAKGFPWFITTIKRDQQHTYIYVDPKALDAGAEVGGVFQKLDKKLAQVTTHYHSDDHAYVTDWPILGEGFVRIGKKDIHFCGPQDPKPCHSRRDL